MSFVVSSLSNYTKDNLDKLITASHFGNEAYAFLTGKGANTQTGIKTAERIHLLAEDIIFQTDSGCGFNASGASTITARTITVGAHKVNKSYCPKDLRAKYTQTLLKAGSNGEREGGSWEADVANENAAKIAEAVEKEWFQGDLTSTDQNLNKFDGLLVAVTVANGAVDANVATYQGGTNATSFVATATSGAARNISEAVNAVWRAFPEGVKGKSDAVVIMGTDLFDLYIISEIAANRYNFNPATTAYEYKIPGTNYTIKGLSGMSGTNKIIGLRASNIYFGTDQEHEEEKFEFIYSEYDELMRFKAAWKSGINVAYVSEVVNYSLK